MTIQQQKQFEKVKQLAKDLDELIKDIAKENEYTSVDKLDRAAFLMADFYNDHFWEMAEEKYC